VFLVVWDFDYARWSNFEHRIAGWVESFFDLRSEIKFVGIVFHEASSFEEASFAWRNVRDRG